MSPASHYLRINGIPYHWLDFGNRRQPPLVCLHGLTRNAWDFVPVAELLSERYHVVAVDIRGRGESGWGSPADYHLAQYVEDLRALIDAWGMKTTSLIGTSIGGLIAILLAARCPHRVERMVLNDIGPETAPEGIRRILHTTFGAPDELPDRAAVIAYFRSYFPTVSPFSDDEVWGVARSSIQASGSGWRWKMDPAVREALLDQRDGRAAPPLWHAFRSSPAKCLVLRGALSDVLSRKVLLKMERERPAVTTVEVPGVGHPPLLSEPSARAALRRFFLERHETIEESHHEAVETSAHHR